MEQIAREMRGLDREDNDDITRVLFFHTNSFRGVEREESDVVTVLDRLGDIAKRRTAILHMPDHDRSLVEKALHRLLLVGVVSDYTVDYASKEFSVRISGAGKEAIVEAYGEYVAGYLAGMRQQEVTKAVQFLDLPRTDFIMRMVRLLLDFVYSTIEWGRRRALNEMYLTCTTSGVDEDIRARILRYLETTEHSEALEQIRLADSAGLGECRELFTSVVSANEAAELRGQVARYLESYPAHPGFLMLRCLSEVFSHDADAAVARQNFTAAVSSASTTFGLSDTTILDFALWAVSAILKRDDQLALTLVRELVIRNPSRDSARILVRQLPTELSSIPAWFLLAQIQEDCARLVSP